MTAAETTTIVLSTLAFGVSLFTLVWQFLRARWERPVPIVGGMIWGSGSSGSSPFERHIQITNIGERPVTITDAGWVQVIDPKSTSYIGLTHDELLEFPVQIPPQSSRTWIIAGGVREEDNGVPYAKVIIRPTWWEKRRGIKPERTMVGALGSDMPLPDPKAVRDALEAGPRRRPRPPFGSTRR